MHAYVLAEIGAVLRNTESGELGGQLSVVGIAEMYVEKLKLLARRKPRFFDSGFRRGGISAHKPSGAQKCASEIARYDNAHIRSAGHFQNIESGHARRALRLSVVGAARAGAAVDIVRPDIVGCVGVLLFLFFDYCVRLVLVSDGRGVGYEYAAFFLYLRDSRAAQRYPASVTHWSRPPPSRTAQALHAVFRRT